MEDKVLGRDDILHADDINVEKVDVPEWGGCIYVKTLSGKERDDWERRTYDRENKFENVRASLVAETACDSTGTKLFTTSDVAALGDKSGAALDRVYDAAQALNGMGGAKLREAVKNLLSGQSVGSSLD